MEPKGEAGGVRVYDSYAHHPTEIAGDLAAARALAGEGRLVVAFQPHLVSRTRAFGAAMGEALGAADEVVVCDVYLAREDPDPEVTGALVAAAVPLPPERVAFVPDLDDVPAALVARAHPGDLVLTLGAGSVTELGPRVLALLEAAPCVASAGRPTTAADAVDKATRRSRKRFARRQWRRRWLAWRYLLALVLVLGARGRRDLGGLVLVLAGGRDHRRQRRPDRRGRRHPGALGHRRRRAAGPRRPGRGRAPDRRAGRRPHRRRHPAVAERHPDQHRGAGRDRGRRDRRPAARHGRRRRGLPRLQEGAARPAARRDLDRHDVGGAQGGGQGDLGAARGPHPDRRPRPGHDGRPDLAGAQGRPQVVWGSADESETKAEVLETLLATVQAQVYDVSVPSKPTTQLTARS